MQTRIPSHLLPSVLPMKRGNRNRHMKRFLRWLLPKRYSPTVRCAICGLERHRSYMLHQRALGWYCNDEHGNSVKTGTHC